MARIRSLKPDLWMSPQVMNLSHAARLLFIGLITQADDEGRGTADLRRLKAAIFGGDDITSADVRRMLDECSTQRLVDVYESENHGLVYSLPSWKSHQSIDRPRKSLYPSPNDRRALVERSSTPREGLEGNGEEGKGMEGKDARVDSSNARPVDNSGDKPPNDPQPDRLKGGGPFGFLDLPNAISDSHDLTERIRAIYPEGTFGGQNWILTERELGKLLDGGEPASTLVEAAAGYAAQQMAIGNAGTQFIRSPAKFYAEGHWRGPFPLPVDRPRPGARQSFAEIHAKLATTDAT